MFDSRHHQKANEIRYKTDTIFVVQRLAFCTKSRCIFFSDVWKHSCDDGILDGCPIGSLAIFSFDYLGATRKRLLLISTPPPPPLYFWKPTKGDNTQPHPRPNGKRRLLEKETRPPLPKRGRRPCRMAPYFPRVLNLLFIHDHVITIKSLLSFFEMSVVRPSSIKSYLLFVNQTLLSVSMATIEMCHKVFESPAHPPSYCSVFIVITFQEPNNPRFQCTTNSSLNILFKPFHVVLWLQSQKFFSFPSLHRRES